MGFRVCREIRETVESTRPESKANEASTDYLDHKYAFFGQGDQLNLRINRPKCSPTHFSVKLLHTYVHKAFAVKKSFWQFFLPTLHSVKCKPCFKIRPLLQHTLWQEPLFPELKSGPTWGRLNAKGGQGSTRRTRVARNSRYIHDIPKYPQTPPPKKRKKLGTFLNGLFWARLI
jgi:hypothetical protein